MKLLKFNGETYEAEKIVKTLDSIIGYEGSSEVFAFRGISDFTKFELAEGQEYDLDNQTSYSLALAELAEAQEQDLLDIKLALAELADIILGGAQRG